MSEFKSILISDFNAGVLAGYLEQDNSEPSVHCHAAPFGGVMPLLLDSKQDCWKEKHELAIVWTRPEAVSEKFAELLSHQSVAIDSILEEVEQYVEAVLQLKYRVNFVLHPSWVLSSTRNDFGLLDLQKEVGISDTLARMNQVLAEKLHSQSGFHVLNAQHWIESAGSKARSPKMWLMAKVPFHNDVFKQSVRAFKSALRGLSGKSKKLIVLDLDNTLWGGIVGDDGWEQLTLGGHDSTGEAFADFQKELQALTRHGILLAIASKNDADIALEAIEKNPEMILKKKDFAATRINWDDKVQNIIAMVNELHLGLEAVVFIDDNPVERARVREALPDVFVPDWPEDKMLYSTTLLNLDCFNTPSISHEDRKRSKQYQEEKKRGALKKEIPSLDDWLQTLNTKVTVESLNDSNLKRTVQLLNKSNQMNLSTRRMTEKELKDWLGEGQRHLWCLRVSDKFGDSGLTGILSVEMDGDNAQVIDFVLSCRVMGRKIEESMLHVASHFCHKQGSKELRAKFLPTEKNKPCLEFWKRSGFKELDGGDFVWTDEKAYPAVDSITLIDKSNK